MILNSKNFFSIFVSGLLVAALSVNSLHAQDDNSNSIKGAEGDWGMTLSLTGLIDQIQLNNFGDSITQNSILIRHYLKDDLALRLGLGVNISSRKTSMEDSIKVDQQLMSTDSVYSQSAYSVSVGLEKHLGETKRLDPYIGAQATLGFIGKTKIDVDTKIDGPTGETTINRDYTLDGGFMVGVYAIGGFNYFIAKKFSVGAEYLFGFTSINRGGNYSDITVTTTQSTSGSTVDKGSISTRNNTVNASGQVNITLSYFF